MKITDALVAEHAIFLSVFDQIERVLPKVTTLAEARTYATVVEGLLESHAQTESNLAYLALDHVLANKDQLDRLYQEHEEIDQRLSQVQSATSYAEAVRLLGAAIHESRKHFRYEEHSVFPLLEGALQHETLMDLGRSWMLRFSAMKAAA